tara:strand:- start:280 stop:945 length:666 start_codon:yes stop_codon:yes gene_type:complete
MRLFFYIIKNIFFKKSLNRIFQEFFAKQLSLKEKNILEFGASKNSSKNFTNFIKISQNSIINFADKIDTKEQIKEDLEKNLSFTDNSIDAIILFNVLEHVYNSENAVSEIYRCLNKSGKLIGSVPFIYRVHYAPEDFCRYSEQYIHKILEKNKFKNISIKTYGYGPFTAAYSILFDYIKFIPIINNILFIIFFLFDSFINLFTKTDLKKLYPITICFSGEK